MHASGKGQRESLLSSFALSAVPHPRTISSLLDQDPEITTGTRIKSGALNQLRLPGAPYSQLLHSHHPPPVSTAFSLPGIPSCTPGASRWL